MWKAWDFQREHGGRRTPHQCDLSLSPMKFFWQFLPTGHLYYLTFWGSSLSHFFSLIIPSLQTQKTHFSSSNIHISESPYLFLEAQTCVNQNGERFYEPSFCLASWIYFYFKDSFSPLFSISLCVGDVFSSHITERPLRLKAFRVSSCLMQGIFNWRAFALVPGRRNLDLEPDCLGLSPGSTPSWALCALVSSSGKWRYYNTHLLEETPGLFMATVAQQLFLSLLTPHRTDCKFSEAADLILFLIDTASPASSLVPSS